MPRERPRWQVWTGRIAAALGLVYGYGSAFLGVGGMAHVDRTLGKGLSAALAVLGGVAMLAVFGRASGRVRRVAFELLAVVVLPVWGFELNAGLPEAAACTDQNRLLALPQLWPFYGLYALTALAYAVARRRREGLPPRQEAVVEALLLCGCAQVGLLILQFGGLALTGLLFGPIGLPLVAPWLVLGLFAWELRRRAAERVSEVGPAPLAGGLLGLYALAHAAWRGHAGGVLEVVTRTASGTFATITPPTADCHYLCTVAAQGHPGLVRPLRWGVRRGRPILVNRQLAVANAFEDLLHERWPRLGRLARRTYDRLAVPVCRYLRWRWAADLVYLAMKPAEWLFMLTLLLLDRRPPEERIARMYR